RGNHSADDAAGEERGLAERRANDRAEDATGAPGPNQENHERGAFHAAYFTLQSLLPIANFDPTVPPGREVRNERADDEIAAGRVELEGWRERSTLAGRLAEE